MAANTEKRVFHNPQIVAIATYLLGGKSKFIDIEDIAIKAYELSPERFSWRRHPVMVDLGTVRDACSDAKKEKNGQLLVGTPSKGYMLTAEGVAFTKKEQRFLETAKAKKERVSKKDRTIASREKTRLMTTAAFEKYSSGKIQEVTIEEAEVFFRLDDYIKGSSRRQKVTRIQNLFADDPAIGPLAKQLAEQLKEAEKGGK